MSKKGKQNRREERRVEKLKDWKTEKFIKQTGKIWQKKSQKLPLSQIRIGQSVQKRSTENCVQKKHIQYMYVWVSVGVSESMYVCVHPGICPVAYAMSRCNVFVSFDLCIPRCNVMHEEWLLVMHDYR